MSAFRNGPTPEEFQKQLSEFMRQHLSAFPGVAAKPATSDSDSTGAPHKHTDDSFAFEKKPRAGDFVE